MSGWAPEPREGRREPLGATGLPLTTEKALAGAPDASNGCSRCYGIHEPGEDHTCSMREQATARVPPGTPWHPWTGMATCLKCSQRISGPSHACPSVPYEPDEQPTKHDAGKDWMPELLPFGALREVCKVFAYGARKYAPHNYRKGAGLAWSRLLGAALRHLFAWGGGEDLDPETGCNHLAHAACCCLMLLDGAGTDDRWRESVKPLNRIEEEPNV